MDHQGKNSRSADPARIPAGISDYIRNNFRKEFLSDIRPVQNKNGQLTFHVDISQDNTLYHLQFNDEGTLLIRYTEPLIELYDDEIEYPE